MSVQKTYIFSDELEKWYRERVPNAVYVEDQNIHNMSFKELYESMRSIYGESKDLFGECCICIAGNVKELGSNGEVFTLEYLYA